MDTDFEFRVCIEYSDYGDKVYVIRYDYFPNIIGVGDTIEEAIEEAQGNLQVFFDYCEENHITRGSGTFITRKELKNLKPDKYAIDWIIEWLFKKYINNKSYDSIFNVYKLSNYAILFDFETRGSFFIRCTDDYEQEIMQERIELTKGSLIDKIKTEAKETNKRER